MTDTPARVTYHFPDDVVVTTDGDGKRVARLACATAWLAARERQRDAERDAFLNTYPAVARDRASWAAFIAEGNPPSISAWLKWKETQ